MMEPQFTASDIDRKVGERIRRRRVLLGLTQDQLGETLGISYQQIQKYETGANRVSAGRLFQIAETLQTGVAWFFEGMSDIDDDSADAASSRHVIDLVRHFSQIEDDRIRAAVLSLVRSLANGAEADLGQALSEGIASNGRNGGAHA